MSTQNSEQVLNTSQIVAEVCLSLEHATGAISCEEDVDSPLLLHTVVGKRRISNEFQRVPR